MPGFLAKLVSISKLKKQASLQKQSSGANRGQQPTTPPANPQSTPPANSVTGSEMIDRSRSAGMGKKETGNLREHDRKGQYYDVIQELKGKNKENKADKKFSRKNSTKDSAKQKCPLDEKAVPKEPCSISTLTIREKWPEKKSLEGEISKKLSKKKGPAPSGTSTEQFDKQKDIDATISQKQQELDKLQDELDKRYAKEWTEAKTRKKVDIQKDIDKLHDEIFKLTADKAASPIKLQEFKPPKGTREFTVVNKVPTDIDAQRDEAIKDCKELREELKKLIEKVEEKHDLNEAVKKEAKDFTQDLEKLATKRDKARLRLELARQKRKKLAQKRDKSKNEKNTWSKSRRWKHNVARRFGRTSSQKLKKAEKEEEDARDKFKQALKNYNDKKKEEPRQRLKKAQQWLDEATKKMCQKLDELNQKEKDTLDLRNTIPTGDDKPIQMVAGGSKKWWTGWQILKDQLNDKTKYDRLPRVTVTIDKDKPDDAPDSFGKYCSEAPGPHPHLKITDMSLIGENMVLVDEDDKKEAEFPVWQARQFGEGLKVPTGKVPIFSHILNRIVQQLLTVVWGVFNRVPIKHKYQISSTSCGFDPEVSEVTKELCKLIEVYPADCYQFDLRIQSLGSAKAEYQYDSSKEDTPHSVTTSTKKAYGLKTKKKVETDKFDPFAKNKDKPESTNLYQEDFVYGDPKVDKITGIPNLPSSFFPTIPVSLSVTRNGEKQDILNHILNIIGVIIFFARETGKVLCNFNEIAPSSQYGVKAGFNIDFLSGSLSFTQQWREHIDRRVYHYRNLNLNINLVTVKFYGVAGFMCKVAFLEVCVGAEVYVKGNVNFKGAIEHSHPDVKFRHQLGVGGTGGITVGAEAKFVPGSEIFFKASGAVTTGLPIDGMFWILHERGPHFDLGIKWVLPKITFTIKVILLGTFEKAIPLWFKKEYGHTFTFPSPVKDALSKQSKNIEKERLESNKRAKKADKRYQKMMKKRK